MQKVVRVDNTAESIVELLALRLAEQGAEFSTPWPQESGRLIHIHTPFFSAKRQFVPRDLFRIDSYL